MTPQDIELRFNVWSKLSQVCVHAGKTPGGPWNIRVTGTCAITKETVRIIAIGTDETFLSCMPELWEKLQKYLTGPALQKVLDNL